MPMSRNSSKLGRIITRRHTATPITLLPTLGRRRKLAKEALHLRRQSVRPLKIMRAPEALQAINQARKQAHPQMQVRLLPSLQLARTQQKPNLKLQQSMATQ